MRIKSLLIAPAKKAAGLRLVATDALWSHGAADAPLVEGPADDLVLALCGRPAGLGAQRGEGLTVLTRRLRR